MSTIGTVIGTHGSYTFFKGLKIAPQVPAASYEDKSANLIKRGSIGVGATASGVGSDNKNDNKSELCVNNSNKNNSGTDNELKLSADR